VLKRLGRGSTINHRAFVLEDNSYIYVRAAKNTTILEIDLEKLREIALDCPILEKKFLSY